MACDYIVVLPLITGTTSVSTGFALPLAPFDTSSWTINLQQPRFNSSSGGTVSVTLYWSGSQPFDTPSHHIQVLFGTSNSSWDATTPLEYDLKKPEDGSSPVYSAQWSAPAYSYDGYISVQAKVKDEALSKLSEVFYPLFTSPHPNDVRIYFPREGRELWANSTMLKKASSYLKKQLESDFAEGQVSTVRTREGSQATALAYEDSDDEDEASTATNPTDDKLACDHSFHTITVTQATYKTYAAVLFWMASDHISFAELKSTTSADQSDQTIETQDPINTKIEDVKISLSASPKSVYRLAHLLELPSLEQLALDNIKLQLKSSSVAYELFSDISSYYPSFRSIVIDFVVANWSVVKESEAFKDMYAKAEAGELADMTTVFVSLALKLK